jgi:hypothetical protein
MTTQFDSNIHRKSQRLADLKNKTVELERKLSDARLSFERELAHFAYDEDAAPAAQPETDGYAAEDWDPERELAKMSRYYAVPRPSPDQESPESTGWAPTPEDRTEVLVNHGRRNVYRPGLSRGPKVAIGIAVIAILITVAVMLFFNGSSSWPSSVARVQSEVAAACQNPDVQSEPGQVNFACGKDTRQILWVFALMTSGNNPGFSDAKSGRVGLEPITPAQGGEVAWSLNLHHPYDPANPVDSLQVAARAINNIIGGATMTGTRGNPVVEPGLESSSANCVRYTGSAAVAAHSGFPALCARPVSNLAGQAALVADVYLKWVAGATPRAAQEAAILFENAQNPGSPQVQYILKHLPHSTM